jgi:hypothetical protein
MVERITLESLTGPPKEKDDYSWDQIENFIKEASLEILEQDLLDIIVDYAELLDSEKTFKEYYVQAYKELLTDKNIPGGIQQKFDYKEIVFFHKIAGFIDKMITLCHRAIIMQLILLDELVNKDSRYKDSGNNYYAVNPSKEKELSEYSKKIKSLIDDAIHYEEQEIIELGNMLEDVLTVVEKIVHQYYGKDLIASIDNIHNKIAPINSVLSSEFDQLAIYVANNLISENETVNSVENNQETKQFFKYLYSIEQRFIEQTKSTEKKLYTIHAALMALKRHLIIAKTPAYRNIEIKVRLSLFETLTKSRQKAHWLTVQKFNLALLLGNTRHEIERQNKMVKK